jgi:AcrR family transcriptional regulator
MRTHGWGGDPPATDEDAAARIVAAAVACVDEHGAGADVAKVAERVGVTRQTVYRYFPTRRALFEAVATHRAGPLVDRLTAHLAGFDDPSDAIVEVVLFCLRALRDDPRLAFIAEPGRADALITASGAPRMALAVIRELPIDLAGLDEQRAATLAEHMVRLLQALLLDAATGARDDEDLRRFLHACLDHHTRDLHAATIRS